MPIANQASFNLQEYCLQRLINDHCLTLPCPWVNIVAMVFSMIVAVVAKPEVNPVKMSATTTGDRADKGKHDPGRG